MIEFAGTFVPVKWECRAPLATGRLCPRKDRVKVGGLYILPSVGVDFETCHLS